MLLYQVSDLESCSDVTLFTPAECFLVRPIAPSLGQSALNLISSAHFFLLLISSTLIKSVTIRSVIFALMNCDEGVTPRLLWMGLPGVPEDRRPTKMPP